jgi:para-aminobenzoate synthetase component 1
MNLLEFERYRIQPDRQGLMRENVEDVEFLACAGACCRSAYSAILLSGGNPPVEGESRYSIAGWEPLATFRSKGRRCTIRVLDQELYIEGNPLHVMDKVTGCFRADFPLLFPPFSGGALGYFAYDLKDSIEHLPQTAQDDLDLPDIVLFWPRHILVHDRIERKVHALSLSLRDEAGILLDCEERGETAFHASPLPFSNTLKAGSEEVSSLRVGDLESNFTHDEYVSAVRKVRHYIREGDVYQVNLSQRYRFPFQGDGFSLWKALFSMNPAAFYAFIDAGDHQVLSTSMERFLYRKGDCIETRPIKGTRKRGQTPEEDAALRRDLAESPKDDAELSMIVDLLRNDLGRVCSARSIRVSEHKRLEAYQNVHHLVSIVTGRLREETTYGKLLTATFPGGSITGCPKIRAMEIIDELEPTVRHVYTGSIGYLGWHENLDLNIAIRTALIRRDTCYFSVGGGIVYDSCEEDEYQETLHKGRTLFQLIERIGAKAP